MNTNEISITIYVIRLQFLSDSDEHKNLVCESLVSFSRLNLADETKLNFSVKEFLL